MIDASSVTRTGARYPQKEAGGAASENQKERIREYRRRGSRRFRKSLVVGGVATKS